VALARDVAEALVERHAETLARRRD